MTKKIKNKIKYIKNQMEKFELQNHKIYRNVE